MNPLDYMLQKCEERYIDGYIVSYRDPTVHDWADYPIGVEWENISSGKNFIFKGLHAIWEAKKENEIQ